MSVSETTVTDILADTKTGALTILVQKRITVQKGARVDLEELYRAGCLTRVPGALNNANHSSIPVVRNIGQDSATGDYWIAYGDECKSGYARCSGTGDLMCDMYLNRSMFKSPVQPHKQSPSASSILVGTTVPAGSDSVPTSGAPDMIGKVSVQSNDDPVAPNTRTETNADGEDATRKKRKVGAVTTDIPDKIVTLAALSSLEATNVSVANATVGSNAPQTS